MSEPKALVLAKKALACMRDFALRPLFAAALAPGASPAFAADLSPKIEAPESPPPEFSWTGIYIGLNVGGAVDHFAFKYAVVPPSPGFFSQGSSGITSRGPLGGLQIGGNYELPFFHIVAGIEIDDSAADITGQATVSNDIRSRLPYNATFGTRVEDFGTARLRLGYGWGRFLPYVTGGFAFAAAETYYDFSSPMFIASGASTALRSGWPAHVGCIGMGAEYALTPSLSVKAEYLYVGINARRTLFSPGDDTLVSFGTRTMFHVIRLGLNYKFDWLSPAPPPVAARY